LGLQAAQQLSVIGWLRAKNSSVTVQVQTEGISSQMVAAIAAALDSKAVMRIESHNGMKSLRYLLDAHVPMRTATEMFCLDLLKEFDLDTLAALASPAKIETVSYLK
jgi:RNA-binding protein YhbY